MGTTCEILFLNKKNSTEVLNLNEVWRYLVGLLIKSNIGLDEIDINTPFVESTNYTKEYSYAYGCVPIKLEQMPWKSPLYFYYTSDPLSENTLDDIRANLDQAINEYISFSMQYNAQHLALYHKLIGHLLDDDLYLVAYSPDDSLSPEILESSHVSGLEDRIKLIEGFQKTTTISTKDD